jgi:hypothetical protein
VAKQGAVYNILQSFITQVCFPMQRLKVQSSVHVGASETNSSYDGAFEMRVRGTAHVSTLFLS